MKINPLKTDYFKLTGKYYLNTIETTPKTKPKSLKRDLIEGIICLLIVVALCWLFLGDK